jgi:(p)ppGpp synthase/HD superfamily hydrolase
MRRDDTQEIASTKDVSREASTWANRPMSKATVLTDRFDRALLYATHVHGGQVRKATSIPYIAHLLAVAATVLEYGGDEDLTIAALLHDSVEDQGGKARLNDVRNRFGERVARIVEGCSETLEKASPRPMRKREGRPILRTCERPTRTTSGYR